MKLPKLADVQSDVMASVVVFLVALPLCMGIAIASGAPPAAGLIAGIVGGIVVGLFSGCPIQVSGPAAGLAVIVYQIIQDHGLRGLAVALTVAGFVQFVAGIFKLGQWFRAVSPAVVQGMLAGIGVLIFASQFHVMVDDEPQANGLANLAAIPAAIWKSVVPLDNSPHCWACRVGLITIGVIVFWKLFAPKKLKFIPGPLVAVVVATAFAALVGLDQIKHVQIQENMFAALSFISLEEFRNYLTPQIVGVGVGMALVASAETLLCAVAVDQTHNDPDCKTNYDRELAAQGFGNMVSAFIGGLPITGVIVRSAANMEAGARTRMSAVLHGVWLLLFVAAVPQVLRLIPTAALAAVLVYTGYKLVNVSAMIALWKQGKGEVLIYAVTMAVIVAEDLLAGVIVGIVLSALKLLYCFSHLSVDLSVRDGEYHMRLEGSATFLKLPLLAKKLEAVPPGVVLWLDLDSLSYIDHACLELLASWEKKQQITGGGLEVDWSDLHHRYRARPNVHSKPQSIPHRREPEALLAGADH